MHNSFQALKAEYSARLINKADFILQAHQRFHHVLFDLANELPNTDISAIEITDNGVCMVSRRDNLRILVDSLDQRTAPVEILNFNAYEPELTAIIRRLAPFIDTMFDIGANIGWYTLLVSRTNPAAVVHSFEPIPPTFTKLKINIDLNKISNVCLHNFGLSSSPGTFPFYFYPEGGVNASLQNLANRADAQIFQCMLKTMSEFEHTLSRNERIDFIKCDVEGNELYVVQGGLSTIEKHKPIILLELLRKWSARFNYHPNDVIEILRQLEYSVFISAPSGSLVPIDSITDETEETNFFFVHPDSRLRHHLSFE